MDRTENVQTENVQTDKNDTLPPNFRSIINDFTTDLTITFSEYSYLWSKWASSSVTDDELQTLFKYCLTVYPERFFDILYKSDKIFSLEDATNTNFLPCVDFKLLYNCPDITETTKITLWKYLQLILFTIVGCVKDKSNFGDTMNMFEGINEPEFQDKLNETMGGLSDFLKNMTPSQEQVPTDKMPDMENMQDNLKSLFNGKIGNLAKEMAEEISGEFSELFGADDMENMKNPQDILQKLMKNPTKIMGLMQTVSGKLDSMMKNGDISKDDIMKEAGDLMGKMKGMGGQNQFEDMFKNLAKTMGGGARLDTNALDRMTKQSATKDRMRQKLVAKQQQPPALIANYSLENKDDSNYVFKLAGESAQEKSFIHPDLIKEIMATDANQPSSKKKNNNNKKKKNNK
jgi:hypothetical protein